MTRRALSQTARMAILNQYERTCQLCFLPIPRDKGFDLDHHIPLAMGGEDAPENMRPLHKHCHRLKTNGDVGAIAKAKRREAKSWGIRKPRTITAWRRFDKTIVRVNRTTGEPV